MTCGILSRFGKLLEEWREKLEDIICVIGTAPVLPLLEEGKGGGGKEEEGEEDDECSKMSLEDLCSEVELWSSNLTYAIDNKDSRRSEEVLRAMMHSTL